MERTFYKEKPILNLYKDVIKILLIDRSSNKNLIWATKNYIKLGEGFKETDFITVDRIDSTYSEIIVPRVNKKDFIKKIRSKEMAEVFTPSWICNIQNNMIDEKWFGRKDVFNIEQKESWIKTDHVEFKNKNQWIKYVKEPRLEITCGEAPYLVSRYDSVTGNEIKIPNRIGLLDRKLRVINENVNDEVEWLKYTKMAFKSSYGYDYQGDNVILARKNLLLTFIEYYYFKFEEYPTMDVVKEIAKIISWNIWQMDGTKYVIPYSCHNEKVIIQSLFEENVEAEFCRGCKNMNNKQHNGIYCVIKDWSLNKNIRFIDLVE